MAPQVKPVQGDDTTNVGAPTIRVVVVGAGPGGLMTAINLLRRNIDATAPKYEVTLVDPGVDHGLLDEEGLSKRRSWMIGLSAHGLDAIHEVPGLFKDYVEPVGVKIRKATFGMGGSIKFTQEVGEDEPGFCVDRNYVCGGLARYLHETFGTDPQFVRHYNTRVLYLDGDNQKVFVRHNNNSHELRPLEYDICIGADGIRSVVRNAFVTNHREFEMDIQGSFGVGKSVHVPLPADVGEGHFMFLSNCMPKVTAFVLPERGQQLNLGMGWNLNDTVADELLSDDPTVVEAYVKANFKGLENLDWKSFAEQWCKQGFNTLQFGHCNFYHSDKLKALLLGDAAHATVPNIGQGMNTALADASALNHLLDTHKDQWDVVLPAFSKERVKEGNALTELSYNTFCKDPKIMLSILLRQNIHRALNGILPEWLLEKEPMNEVGFGMKLSVAYDKMVRYGYMAKARKRNDDLKREWFEKHTGMVQERPESSSWFNSKTAMVGVLLVAVGCGVALSTGRSKST